MDLVRPGPDARPDAGEERAENEEQDGSFPPHPGSPGNLSTHAQAAAQTGVRGMAQGNIPALSDRKTFVPVSVRSPMMYVGKGGSSMADKAVCSVIPVMPTAHTGPEGAPGKGT